MATGIQYTGAPYHRGERKGTRLGAMGASVPYRDHSPRHQLAFSLYITLRSFLIGIRRRGQLTTAKKVIKILREILIYLARVMTPIIPGHAAGSSSARSFFSSLGHNFAGSARIPLAPASSLAFFFSFFRSLSHHLVFSVPCNFLTQLPRTNLDG